MRIAGVHEIRNIGTGERFFGSSVDIHRARKRHQDLLRGDRHFNYALQDEWLKFGEASFAFTVLDEVAGIADMRKAARARIERQKPNYNTNWWPRTRVHIVELESRGARHQTRINPTRTFIETKDDEALDGSVAEEPVADDGAARRGAPTAPSHVSVLRQDTYRVPHFECDVPLLHASDGNAYVPVEAWFDLLGVRLTTHLWRLRRTGYWHAARELPWEAPVPTVPGDAPPSASQAHKCAPHRPDADHRSVGAPDAARPSWCLPLESLAHVGSCLPRAAISPEKRALLGAFARQAMEEEEREREARRGRVWRYRAVRARLYRSLRDYRELEQGITPIIEHVLTHLDPIAGVELELLRARGGFALASAATAARTALLAMRTGAVTEVTWLDHYGEITESDAVRIGRGHVP